MKKLLIQSVLSISLFFSIWFLFKQINWVSIFKTQEISNKTEEKLGEIFWEAFQVNEKENHDPFIINTVDSIVTKICLANKIERGEIKFHILHKDEVNAFALPNGHLVIYSGLIINSDNQEQLSGVLCHEIAHIKLKHVMKKLLKELGFSVIISMTTGNYGTEAIKSIIEKLSSSAFDRSLEKEADIIAVNYLINANINPEGLSTFLYGLSDKENDISKYLSWINTHPDSKERAKYITEYSRGRKVINHEIVKKETWIEIKSKLKQLD